MDVSWLAAGYARHRLPAAFGPHAPTPEVRLAQAAERIEADIPVEAKLDPILPGVTDRADCLDPLRAASAHIGVRRIARCHLTA